MPRPPQPLHILQKDVLHLWPEILVSLLVYVAFAVCAPENWQGSPYLGIIQLVWFLLHVLLPVAWLVLIARLIHDETLVGDRQFWTSRPYHWAGLLASKVLFLILFIYVPFALMQIFLLKHAGLHPTTALPGLFKDLGLLTVYFILPLTAIAAVTGTFTRMLLSTIGAVLYMLVAFGVIVWLVFERMRPPVLNHILLAVVILLPAAALIYQYATRRTTISRVLLLATPLLLILVTLALPYGPLLRADYKTQAGSADPTLSDFPEQLRPKAPQPGRLAVLGGKVQVQIPYAVTGADRKSGYLIQGVAISITAPNLKWTSDFTESPQEQQLSSGNPVAAVTVPIPQNIFNQIRSTPADVHLVLATSHLKAGDPQTWKAGAPAFDVPGHGVCTWPASDVSGGLDPVCNYPYEIPRVNFAEAKLAAGSCSGPTVPARGRLTAQTQLPNFLDPVASVPFSLRTEDPSAQHQYTLCAGTPVEFIEAQDLGHVRFDVDLKGLILDNYAIRFQREQQGAQPQSPQVVR